MDQDSKTPNNLALSTPVSSKEERLEKAAARLNDKELEAYTAFCASKQPSISPVTAAKMFGLYINGSDCTEIKKLSPGFDLGQIVHAKVLGNWDVLKEEHLERLLLEVRGRVQQVQLETIMVVADALSATNKANSDAIKKFLLTGDNSELRGTIADSLNAKNYKELIDLIMKLTGQDVQKVKSEVQHTVVDAGVSVRKPPTHEEAVTIIQKLKNKS